MTDPVCTIVGELTHAVVYEDGEIVIIEQDCADCSEHGNLTKDINKKQCDHDYDDELKRAGIFPKPVIEIKDLQPLVFSDKDLLKAASERFAEFFPEDAVGIFVDGSGDERAE